MTTTDRLLLKLLAQGSTQVTQALTNAMCGEPDRGLVLAMVREARATLEEFEEGYAAAIEPPLQTSPITAERAAAFV